MKIELAIFDFDGTLAVTCNTIVNTMQSTLRQMQLPVADTNTCKATIGLPLKSCFAQIYPQLNDETLDKCAATYRDIFNKNKTLIPPTLFPNVKDTLAELKQQGTTITIASSRSSASLIELSNVLGISYYISYIVGADNVTNAKPSPEPVLQILDALGMKAKDTIVVGDMPVDIIMGRNAGTFTCGVTYGNASKRQLIDAHADYIIEDLSQLLKII